MKKCRMFLCLFLVLAMLSGCGARTEPDSSPGDGASNDPSSGTSIDESATFSFSAGIDENGFWEGIRALDYVETFDYQAIQVPADVHQVSEEDLQSEIDTILASFPSGEQIFDRAVAFGDTVNIDYVGSVDGVEFDGGSTSGMGTNVTAGSRDYIDDFLDQIIGHMPGETINIEVTFPDDYGQEALNGQDALFITTINYISEEKEVELTDDFVAENLSSFYGWATVAEMKEGVRSNFRKFAIQEFINQYFSNEVPVKSIPDKLIRYQEGAMINYFKEYAGYYGMEFEEFLLEMEGVSSVEELIESNQENNMERARFYLVSQAIAESEGFVVSDEDLVSYFLEHIGTDDFSSYEEQYGLPYLRQVVLYQKVLDFVVENAVLV